MRDPRRRRDVRGEFANVRLAALRKHPGVFGAPRRDRPQHRSLIEALANDAPLLFDVTRLIWRRWAGRHPTGIDRVCLAYLEHFRPRAQAVVHHPRFRRILDRKTSGKLFQVLATPRTNVRAGLVRNILRSAARRRQSANGRLYLNVGHTGLNDSGFAAWVRDTDVRPLYFVHDLIPITHPEYCRSGERAKHVQRMRTVLKTGTGVIGNSQATLDELRNFGRSESLPILPEIAAWLGTEPWTVSGTVAPPVQPTFVVLGTIEARKNHILLLQIWKRLVSRLGSRAPKLLIIGQRGWESEEVFALLDGENFGEAVVEMSDCTDAELTRHLTGARALLFPSLVEGYGLPLVEALRVGTPVIASNLPVFREIGGDVPDYLDPLAAGAWELAILNYAEPDSPARTAQLKRMTSYRAPTWDEHFSRVEAWMAQF